VFVCGRSVTLTTEVRLQIMFVSRKVNPLRTPGNPWQIWVNRRHRRPMKYARRYGVPWYGCEEPKANLIPANAMRYRSAAQGHCVCNFCEPSTSFVNLTSCVILWSTLSLSSTHAVSLSVAVSSFKVEISSQWTRVNQY